MVDHYVSVDVRTW